MEVKKNNLFLYGIISIFVLMFYIGKVNAANYINYYDIEMTNQEYNNLLNLGFSDDEIYYMDEETFEVNKDITGTLVSRNEKFYKTIYTDLNGGTYSVEITEDEYNNQGTTTPRGQITTEYKSIVSTLTNNGNTFRYKISVAWRLFPSTRSYDIIGIGFEDDVYISSSVYFNYYHCNSSGNCTTASDYYNKKKTSTGGSAVYKLPSYDVRSLSATLYYDVSKDTTNTITFLQMCGDYSHATTNVDSSDYSGHSITSDGIQLGHAVSYYDATPCAYSSWGGSW